jgi:hypothetical protein
MRFLGELFAIIARRFLTFTRNRKSSRFAKRAEADNDPLPPLQTMRPTYGFNMLPVSGAKRARNNKSRRFVKTPAGKVGAVERRF